MTTRRNLIIGGSALAATSIFALPTGAEAAASSTPSGNYYLGVTPDDGAPDTGGGLIPFSRGTLCDGDQETFVGWRGSSTAPRTIPLVFDLGNDYPLDRIRIVSNAPDASWGFNKITVLYRAAGDSAYHQADTATRTGEATFDLTVPMANRTARFIRIDITRSSALLNVPLAEVEIHHGDGVPGRRPGPALTVEQMQAELNKYTRLLDRYGQYLYQAWPGKITSDAQLHQEYARERVALARVAPDRETYDQYGGLKSLGSHGTTGYFRLQQVDGRWWFVTPDGHLFFLKAVDAFSTDEWGYGALYQNADGSARDIFDQLPDRHRFGDAYAVVEQGLHTVNFIKANLIRKYGDNYLAKWRDITRRRFIDWGFNAQGKWARDPAVPFPYIERAPTPTDTVKVLWGIDPFDPDFSAKLDRTFDIRQYRTDPWMIGYFFENERGWSRDVVAEVVTHDATLPAKRAFVQYLADTYHNDLAQVNRILGTSAESFDALTDLPLSINRVPTGDVSAFITLAAKEYFRKVRDAIRRQDPNHLFLGSCLVPTWRTSPEWNVGGAEYVDALSFDWYSTSVTELTRYAAANKPILNLEYGFMRPDRGLTSPNAGIACTSQAERGARHRAFIEALAKNPTFVGSAWFAHYDQSAAGKPGATEAFNIGLVNQQDQPYHEMTDVMRETNRHLEAIHLTGEETD